MERTNFDFFAFFGAILPGIPTFIMLCFLATNAPFSYNDIIHFVKEMSLSQLSATLIICYAIGFCFHYPAYELFKLLIQMWGVKRTKGLPISIGKREPELVLIRHKSPENFKLIHKFLALRQMSYSMMFSLLVFFTLLLMLTCIHSNWTREILFTSVVSLVFGFLFLRRAIAFHQRIQEMITESARMP